MSHTAELIWPSLMVRWRKGTWYLDLEPVAQSLANFIDDEGPLRNSKSEIERRVFRRIEIFEAICGVVPPVMLLSGPNVSRATIGPA